MNERAGLHCSDRIMAWKYFMICQSQIYLVKEIIIVFYLMNWTKWFILESATVKL